MEGGQVPPGRKGEVALSRGVLQVGVQRVPIAAAAVAAAMATARAVAGAAAGAVQRVLDGGLLRRWTAAVRRV